MVRCSTSDLIGKCDAMMLTIELVFQQMIGRRQICILTEWPDRIGLIVMLFVDQFVIIYSDKTCQRRWSVQLISFLLQSFTTRVLLLRRIYFANVFCFTFDQLS